VEVSGKGGGIAHKGFRRGYRCTVEVRLAAVMPHGWGDYRCTVEVSGKGVSSRVVHNHPFQGIGDRYVCGGSFGVGTPGGNVAKLPWNKSPVRSRYNRPWTAAGGETTEEPPGGAKGEAGANGGPMGRVGGGRKRLHDRPATSHGPVVAGEAGERVNHEILKPVAGQWVQIRADTYSVVTGVVDEGMTVLLADFLGFEQPPFLGHPVVRREDLTWDPRGWWRFVLALGDAVARQQAEAARCTLFRGSRAVSRTGLRYNASAVNEALPPSPKRRSAVATPVWAHHVYASVDQEHY
jgi:hypothetical protein